MPSPKPPAVTPVAGAAADAVAPAPAPQRGPAAALALQPAPAHELIVGGQRSGKSRRAEQLAKAWLAQNATAVAVDVVAQGGESPRAIAHPSDSHGADEGQRGAEGEAGGKGCTLPFGATFIATAQALDGDMHSRIVRHRADRAEQLPDMGCVEEPLNLAQAVLASATAHDARHLLVIDCLTLWLSNLMHAHGAFAEVPDAPEALETAEPSAAETSSTAQTPSDVNAVQGEGDSAPAPWLQVLHTQTQALVQALAACQGPVVLVSNEVGLGLTPLGREVRAYVDELGRLNQQVAAACDRVCLMVAGQPLMVKGK